MSCFRLRCPLDDRSHGENRGMQHLAIIRKSFQLRYTVALIKISQLSDALLSVIRNNLNVRQLRILACGYKN